MTDTPTPDESKTNDGGPAYPYDPTTMYVEDEGRVHPGMSLRQWYAGRDCCKFCLPDIRDHFDLPTDTPLDRINQGTWGNGERPKTVLEFWEELPASGRRTAAAAIRFDMADAMLAHEQQQTKEQDK